MNFEEIVKQRRAVKHFDANYLISKNEEQKLLDLAFETPSSFNIQHWRLVKITDKNIRQQIREYAWNQSQVTDASLLYVLCADIKAWEKNPAQYWSNANIEVQDMIVPMIKNFYSNKEQLQRDEAMRSVGLIAQTIMLSAKYLGYDSCPMIGFDSIKVAEFINLPEDHIIGMILAIGKCVTDAKPKGGYLPREKIVLENSF